MPVSDYARNLWNKTLDQQNQRLVEDVSEYDPRYDPNLGKSTMSIQQEPIREETDKEVGGNTFLGRVFDVLQRGEYASANIAMDYILARDFDVNAAVEGFKGERKATYDEVVDIAFEDWGNWKKKSLAFALSIFADPTTYIPAGVVSKPLKKGGQLVSKTKLAQKMGKSRFAKMFKPDAGLPKEYYELKYYAKTKLGADHKAILDDVAYLGRNLYEDDRIMLSYFREHPQEVHRMSPKLRMKLSEIGDRFDGLVDDAVDSGIIDTDMAKQWRAKETPYMYHYYPEQRKQIASGEIPPGFFEKMRKPSFLKGRVFDTIEDAKRVSDEFADIAVSRNLDEAVAKIEQYGMQDAFESNLVMRNLDNVKSYAKSKAAFYKPGEDILQSLGMRSMEQASYKARTKFVDDTLNLFGERIKPGTKIVPEGYGVYLPKGNLRFYVKDVLDPKFATDLRQVGNKLKNLSIKTEKTVKTKTTTETSLKQGAALAESGPLAKLEEIVKESLTNRGITDGEAEAYIGRLKASGGEASDEIIKEVKQRQETIKTILDSKDLEGDLFDLSKLTEAQARSMVGVTSRVPTYALPVEIAQDMNRGMQTFYPNNPLYKMLRKTTNAWKMMATTIRLPFHLRNMYSNWWQAYLSGINPGKLPKLLLESGSIQSGFTKQIKVGKEIYSHDEFMKLAEEMGVMGKGWMGADIAKSEFRELESIITKGRLRHANPFKLGGNFGRFIENNSRVSVFLDQLRKGKSPKEASKSVRKYLFDYSELTDFEKRTMQMIFPFYTWSRKNIPLQLENLIAQPRKYQVYAKGMRVLSEHETRKEKKYRPAYFEEMLYVKSPFKTPRGKPEYWSIDLPPQEFNRMTSLRHWISSLNPWMLLAEIKFNFRTFPELSALQSQPLEKTRAPFWVAYLPDKFKKIMKDAKVIDTIISPSSGKKILGMDKKWVHVLQKALPFMNELNRINAQPIHVEDESPELKWKSYRSGVSRSSIPLKAAKIRRGYKTRGEESRYRKFVRQHGRKPTKKEKEKLGFEIIK
jgi:hypothetical protein